MSYNEGERTFIAGEALATNRRVKIESGTTTKPPEVVYADAGEQHIGITQLAVADGVNVTVRMRTHPGTQEAVAAGAFSVGATLYGAADGKVDDTSSGTAIGIALEAATANNDVVEIIEFTTISTTAATVSIADAGSKFAGATVEAALQECADAANIDITDAGSKFTGTTVEAALQECAAAATVDLADAGSLVTATEVEAALQEAFQHIQTAQAFLNLPLGAWTEQDGTALADFADGASTTPGWSAGDEGFGVRWNNHAAPDPISTSVPIPPDLDESADVILHVMAAKTGATVGDATTFTVEAFNNADGALYDADADFGGVSSAMTGDATAKTCQEETLTLAAANVAASPCVLTLTLQPTDGTLGTDDVILLGVWLEYTRKTLTS